MSPRTFRTPAPHTVEAALGRMWLGLGIELRDARLGRRWSVREVAHRANVSPVVVYRLEAGESGSSEAAVRVAHALGLRVELRLTDPRRPEVRSSLSVDLVHSAMGELETAHLRGVGAATGVDEPYQHYQFAGRADVVAWNLASRALLHIENRTRFPDFQGMAGAYNAKRSYLAPSLGERLGVRRWASQTHVIAALWSAEVLHSIRMRRESFRSLCPDSADAFRRWWAGGQASNGDTSTLIVLDPLAAGRQRRFIDFDEAVAGARPRYRGYADAAELLAG